MTGPSGAPGTQRLVLVTGPSGAGRLTAIRALEDLGYEVIDNLPLSLAPRLFAGPLPPRPLALGIDVRNRDFSIAKFRDFLDTLAARPDLEVQLLYLDADEGTLIRRYSETRRRHPLSPEEAPREGIAQERDLLTPIRARADVLIDTSPLSPHDLRDEIGRWFATADSAGLNLTVESFSYKRGLPRGLDLVFDCRFLRNPHWQPDLRPLTGRDPAVDAYVAEDPRFSGFYDGLSALVLGLLPAYRDEGKSHLSIGFGCTGGQHRSVAVTERFAQTLAQAGWPVSSRHRELERQAALVRQEPETKGAADR